MGLRAIFFDLDDTLVDYQSSVEAGLRVAWREMARAYPFLSPQQCAEIWDELFPHGAPEGRAVTIDRLRRLANVVAIDGPRLDDTLVTIRDRYQAARVTTIQPLPGADDLLRTLAARFPLALVSNGTADSRRLTLARFGWHRYFRAIVIDTEVGYSKPDPRIFQHALAAVGCAPDEVLFVGDNPRADVVGALAIGMTAVWLNWKRQPRPPDLVPSHEITSLDELRGIVEAQG